MITIIVPTRNRAHTIRLVGESLFRQENVNEIIFVDDAGSDDTPDVVRTLARKYPAINARILRNDTRRGASFSRIKGYQAASNEYIMYVDDDIYVEPHYAATCVRKIEATGAAIVSGRRTTKRPDQTIQETIHNFGAGPSDRKPFRYLFCDLNEDAHFDGDIEQPLLHSTIVTRRSLLEELSYDPHYSKGSGYREESDFQMNAFVNGHRLLTTNDCHCVELSRIENRTGGQRTSRFAQWYWSVRYTNYFYRKYYKRYAARVGLRTGRRTAVALFAVYQVYMLFIRPARRLPALLRRRRPVGAVASVSASG